jgi:hypothetical protein
MARESWIDVYGLGHDRAKFIEALKHFESIVRADQDQKYKWDVHSCGPTCTKAVCVAMREAVEAKREACAMVCTEIGGMGDGYDCAAAIRAKGENT